MKLHHISYEVSNLLNSAHFYAEVFGFEREYQFVMGDESILFIQKDGVRIELIEADTPVHTESVHLCFEVDEISNFKKWQSYIVEGPCVYENGYSYLFLKGPDGEWIECVSLV